MVNGCRRVTTPSAIWRGGFITYQITGSDAVQIQSQAPVGIPTWLQRLHVPALHLLGIDGSGVKFGIVDTGCDASHPYLAPAVVGGRSFVSGDSWGDVIGHGTHVAGIIRQVAPGAQLVIAKGLSDQGSGEDAGLASAIRWLKEQGVDIINASWGSTEEGSPDLHAAIQEAVAAGILFVAAAGNDGHRILTIDTVRYPARWQEPLAVAATMEMAQDIDGAAFYSSAGPEVDVSAPGTGIVSCAPGGGWVEMSGTSMGTPVVAGLTALYIQLFERMMGRKPTEPELVTLHYWQTRDIGPHGRDLTSGVGQVDAVPLAVKRKVTVQADSSVLSVVELPVNQTSQVALSVPAHIVDPPGSFVVPYRAESEALGARVSYDGTTKTGIAEIDVILQE